MENNDNKKIVIVLSVLFALIIFAFGGWLLYGKFFNNAGNSNDGDFKENWTEADFKDYNFVDERNNKIDATYMRKLNEKYLAIETEGDRMTNAAYIFDVKQKKVILSETDDISDGFVLQFINAEENDNYIVLNNKCLATCSDYYSKIYTNDLKLISDDFIDYDMSDKNVAIINDNNIKIFDLNGELTKDISNYSNIIDFEKNYVLYLDNKTIKVSNIDNGNLIAIVGTINDDEKIDHGRIDLDDNEEYIGIVVYTISEELTYQEALNDMEKEDAYDPGENGFGYDDIEELEYYERKYIYTYNFKTYESSKRAIFINFE